MSFEISPNYPSPNFAAFSWADMNSSIHNGSQKEFKPESSKGHKVHKSSRRRIVRACMRCRLRKTKCDGGKPCTRCTEADDVCEYMKCSKKESKEYSQDYVDRLLEQNDKYKSALRILYANRRLSIQPDNLVIPSTESDDVPLVHDILEHLGMIMDDDDNGSEISDQVDRAIQPRKKEQTISSTSSIPSPAGSRFNSAFLDDTFGAPTVFEEPITYFQNSGLVPLELDMGLSIPYEAYSAMHGVKNGSDIGHFPQEFGVPLDMGLQHWDPMVMLDADMIGEQSWHDMGVLQSSF